MPTKSQYVQHESELGCIHVFSLSILFMEASLHSLPPVRLRPLEVCGFCIRATGSMHREGHDTQQAAYPSRYYFRIQKIATSKICYGKPTSAISTTPHLRRTRGNSCTSVCRCIALHDQPRQYIVALERIREPDRTPRSVDCNHCQPCPHTHVCSCQCDLLPWLPTDAYNPSSLAPPVE